MPSLPDGTVCRSSGNRTLSYKYLQSKVSQSINLCNHFTKKNLSQIGPHAVNLAGGQAASMRIAEDILQCKLQCSREPSDLRGSKSKTEDYIKQMQGLLWL